MTDEREGHDALEQFSRYQDALLAEFSKPSWHNAHRGWTDVLRCATGRHRAYLRGDDMASKHPSLAGVERCSCGAIQDRYGPWGFVTSGERKGIWKRREGTWRLGQRVPLPTQWIKPFTSVPSSSPGSTP